MKEITVIHGFGKKHYDSAIYIDGILFSSNADFDNENGLLELVKKMVKNFSIKWTEFTAPQVFRLSSYYSPIPETLAAYEQAAVDIFKELTTFESIEEYIYYSGFMDERQIKFVVYTVYALSGGQEENFEEFYKIYQSTFPKVDSELEKQYAYLNYQYEQERYGDKEKQEVINQQLNEICNQLDNQFKKQLQFVWDHPKKLDKFKVLAIEN